MHKVKSMYFKSEERIETTPEQNWLVSYKFMYTTHIHNHSRWNVKQAIYRQKPSRGTENSNALLLEAKEYAATVVLQVAT